MPDLFHGQPETIVGPFVADLKAYYDSVDGRVKLIHEFFIQIGSSCNIQFVQLRRLVSIEGSANLCLYRQRCRTLNRPLLHRRWDICCKLPKNRGPQLATVGRSSRRIRLQRTAFGLRPVRYQQHFFFIAARRSLQEDNQRRRNQRKVREEDRGAHQGGDDAHAARQEDHAGDHPHPHQVP